MHRTISCAVAMGLLSLSLPASGDDSPAPEGTPAAATPSPVPAPAHAALAPTSGRVAAPRPPLPPADPLMDLGGGAIISGTFALVVLAGCGFSSAPSNSKLTCVAAAGLSALGLLGAGIPMVLVARQRTFMATGVPYVDPVTFTAGGHRTTAGWTWTF